MHDIVLIGSSIFEFWQQPNWGKLNISNNAIRSTTSQYWCDADLSLLPQANHYLVYCGSNDLIFGKSKEQIVSNINVLLNKLTVQFPNTQIGYFSIMKCPQKRTAGQLDIIDYINSEIEKLCCHHISYFEFNDLIDNDNKWFTDDGLHLTDEAYQMLDKKLTPLMATYTKSIKLVPTQSLPAV